MNYFLFGKLLSSAIPLPSLPAWQMIGKENAPDITLTIGDTPQSLATFTAKEIVFSSPLLQIAADKSALVNVPAVGRFYLPNGSKIILQPAPNAQPADFESIFLSTVAALLLYQLSILPLHASCVLIDGRAIAISGHSTLGKSALAAALVRRGASLLADDVCALAPDTAAPHVLPAVTRVRLWPDVLDKLAVPADHRLPTRAHHPRHAVELASAKINASAASSFPLTHLFRLSLNNIIASPECDRKHGPMSVMPAKGIVYQQQFSRFFSTSALEFRSLTALPRHTAIYALQRTRSLSQLDLCADLILAAISESA